MESWSLNIRAYIHSVLKKTDQTLQDVTEAYEIAHQLAEEYPQSRDVNFSIAVIAENTAAVFEFIDDIYLVKHWLYKSCCVNGYHKTSIAVGSKTWSDINRRLLRLDLAIEDVEVGLKAAKEQSRSSHLDLYLNYLRDFNYRLGRVDKSLEYVEESLKFLKHFQDDKRFTTVATLGAKYATVAGMTDQAEKYYDLMTSCVSELDASSLAIYTAYHALNAAKKGKLDLTEQLINQSIN